MKNIILILLATLLGCNTFAQRSLAGDWQGILQLKENPLTIIMHIKHAGPRTYTGTWDSPNQFVFGKECSSISVKGDTAIIEMKEIRGQYQGVFVNDTTLVGRWMQGPASMPLLLKKSVVPLMAGPKRPQTPKPPFTYNSENVLYYNADSSIRYGATITAPKGAGPFPAVLLVTGSGQQNRDEELLGHKPFAVLADYLTNRGFVVMRVDDRGMGQSTGNVAQATTADFAGDVNVSLNYLLHRTETDKKRTGLLGHSEGGMIAEMIAAQRNDVNFIVLMAGPGVKVTQLMAEQNEAVAQSEGRSPKITAAYLTLYKKLAQDAIANSDTTTLRNAIRKDVKDWLLVTPDTLAVLNTGIYDSASEQRFLNAVTTQLSYPWMRYFLAYDPAPVVEKISCKVLALDGDKDIQVVAKSNLAGLKASLEKSKSRDYEVKMLPGLNHLFQTCHTCNAKEYGELEETISPVALEVIGGWLDVHVK